MNRTLASLGLGIVSVLYLTAGAGCGSSASREGFDDGSDPNIPGGSLGADGGPLGSGQPGTLNCKGLEDGTKSSAGCDYYAVVPDVLFGANGACYAVFLANTWKEPIAIGVEYNGQALQTQNFAYIPKGTGQQTTYTPLTGGLIPPGEVAIVFLDWAPGGIAGPGLNFNCPAGIKQAISGTDVATHGTARGHAFHITTTAAVAAYDIYPYGGGQSAVTSATLLLPSTSWDTNYIAVAAYDPGTAPPVAGLSGEWDQIVGEQDGTQVTVNPTSDIPASGDGTIAAATKGKPVTYTVGRGEVIELLGNLEGSVIQSSAPVGVFAGQQALGIQACCDDSAHQQIPPVRALGNEYVGVRYRDRYEGKLETPPWRLVGAVDGTNLTWEPSTPPGAPTTLNRGQAFTFMHSGDFVVTSDATHPFYMSQHMTGGGVYDPDPDNGGDGRGDAEFVNMVPPGEFESSYVFFTDPTYPETNLVVIRTKGKDGFKDVNLDCAGVLSGWTPVGTSGNYEYTKIDLVRHNFAPQGNCNNGRHEMKSDAPFGLTVWGWGSAETGQLGGGFYSQYASYAYPGGANVQPINNVVVSPQVN